MRESSAQSRGSSLAAYLLEIQRFPILTPAEEAGVVARLQDTDSETELHRLVQSNLRFVVKIARQYQGRSVALDDLISQGNLGLLRAARRFEPARGARFLSCAVWWIRKAILDALESRGALIHVPRYQQLKSREALRRVEDDRPGARGRRRPGAWSERYDAHGARRLLPIEVSLGTPVSADSSRTLGETLPDSSAEDPMEVLLRQETRIRVRRALRRLTPREARVLSWRYGFGGRRIQTLEEVGRKLGVSREAVRQMEARAHGKLSRILLCEDWDVKRGSRGPEAGVAPLRKERRDTVRSVRPALSAARRSRCGSGTPSACTGWCEG